MAGKPISGTPLSLWPLIPNPISRPRLSLQRVLEQAFDHDLADFYDENTREYTGMDCAKWLVGYCLENNLPCPEFVIHSANPPGPSFRYDFITTQ